MKRNELSAVVVSALALLGTLLLTSPAAAHNLGVEPRVRGDKVVVEAFFDDNTSAIGARITVKDAAGKIIAEGKTDAQGRWEFPRPAAGKYRFIANAGAGHRAQYVLEVPATASAPKQGTKDRPETVSSGPVREEFTRPHWGRVALGLLAIAGLAAAWVYGRRWLTQVLSRRTASS